MTISAGVYVDDSGTPGTTAPSTFLHLNRKSWAAVIVPERSSKDVGHALRIFLSGIAEDYGANELHFTDIYGGRGQFKGKSLDERYELFDLMAEVFHRFQLPIYFQTCSPEFLQEMRSRNWPRGSIGLLDMANHEHVGLVTLLAQVRHFILQHRQYFPRPLPVVIDQGIVKAGTKIGIPRWADAFTNGEMVFHHSHKSVFLQLADFAAFTIARTQWILSKGQLNALDQKFLNMVHADRLPIINLPSVSTHAESHTRDAYEEFLREDRIAKGLPGDPPPTK